VDQALIPHWLEAENSPFEGDRRWLNPHKMELDSHAKEKVSVRFHHSGTRKEISEKTPPGLRDSTAIQRTSNYERKGYMGIWEEG